MKWIVQVKGQKCSESWEISVVRTDNKHGQLSWGWFDDTKLLVSHNGANCRWPICEFVWDRQIEIAHELCAKLNEESEQSESEGVVKECRILTTNFQIALAAAIQVAERNGAGQSGYAVGLRDVLEASRRGERIVVCDE